MGKIDTILEISESDCFEVVSKALNSEDFTILSSEQIAFAELNGYLGEHCTLKVDIERNDTRTSLTFFVKSLPKVLSQRKFLLEINGFLKEKRFYTKYCPELKQNSVDILDGAVPACYLSNEETFIFEDLTSKGYAALPSRVPMRIDCVKSALIALSKLHASGLILEELKSFRLTDEYAEELRESFYAGTESTETAMVSCKHGIRAVIDMTHNTDMEISKESFTLKALESCDRQKTFIEPSTRFRNTICHADAWSKNFMFQFDGSKAIDCVIVDFQTYRYGPPAQDVVTFIYLVTDRDLRDRHMDELLSFYYGELNRNMEKFGFKDIVTQSEFFDSCHYFKQFAIMQSITHCQVVILSDEIAKELFEDPDKAKFVLFENKYDFVVAVCQRDVIYKNRNFELIAELRKFYTDDKKM